MTDFVLEQTELYKEDKLSVFDFELRMKKYAQFLKQPLKLEMFIPCDDEGNVLEEPCSIGVGNEFYYERALDQYEQAKEKVLFEGWEKRIENHEAFKQHLIFTKTIENAIGWNLTLTTNATKQFL